MTQKVKSQVPGTVSKILWHFTGGPKWNERSQSQNKNPKSVTESRKALCGILKKKTVLTSGYHEQISIVLPETKLFNQREKAFLTKKNVRVTIPTSKVCCVADIPIQHLGYHANRYGRIAIGFHRDSIVKAGFNPVFYTLPTEKLISTLYSALKTLESVDPGNALSEAESITDQSPGYATCPECDEEFEVENSPDLDISNIEAELDDLAGFSSETLKGLMQIASFIKTFNKNEFSTIYCEREWRSTSEYIFNWPDISMIVMPREGKVFEKFCQNDTKRLKIPKDIPIIAWEDLVEN